MRERRFLVVFLMIGVITGGNVGTATLRPAVQKVGAPFAPGFIGGSKLSLRGGGGSDDAGTGGRSKRGMSPEMEESGSSMRQQARKAKERRVMGQGVAKGEEEEAEQEWRAGDFEEGGFDSVRGAREDFVSLGDSMPSALIDEVYQVIRPESGSDQLSLPPPRGTNITDSMQICREDECIADNVSFPEDSIWKHPNASSDDGSDAVVGDSGAEGGNRALLGHEESKNGSDEQSQVMVDFELFDPVENDREAIMSLLKWYLDGREFDTDSIATDIISQGSTVGAVQRVGESNETYGFITALPLRLHQGKAWYKQIIKYLRKRCPASFKDALEAALSTRVHLIVSERLTNLPCSLAVPLTASLFDELAWARGERDGEEEGGGDVESAPAEGREAWVADWYLAITAKAMVRHRRDFEERGQETRSNKDARQQGPFKIRLRDSNASAAHDSNNLTAEIFRAPTDLPPPGEANSSDVKAQEIHGRSSGANAVVRDGAASTADSSAYAGGGLSSLMGSSAGGVDFWRPEDQAFGEAAKEEGGVRFAFQLSGDRG